MICINTNDSILFLNKNGWRHRLDGPAVIVNEKHQVWYVYGKLHRLDGPAIIQGNLKEWYIEGKKYNKHEYYNKLKEMGLKYDTHL